MNALDPTGIGPTRQSSRRSFSRVRRLAPALLLSLAPLLGAGQPAVVHADGTCTPSGNQVTCTFGYTGGDFGADQPWVVPPGVSSVQVTAVGQPGFANVTSDGTGTLVPGGKAARVTATVPLPAGTTALYVEVGGGIQFSGSGDGTPGTAATPRTCARARGPSARSSGMENLRLAMVSQPTAGWWWPAIAGPVGGRVASPPPGQNPTCAINASGSPE
jgi:hypothetical protein